MKNFYYEEEKRYNLNLFLGDSVSYKIKNKKIEGIFYGSQFVINKNKKHQLIKCPIFYITIFNNYKIETNHIFLKSQKVILIEKYINFIHEKIATKYNLESLKDKVKKAIKFS